MEEKAKIERESTLKAASSFSMRNMMKAQKEKLKSKDQNRLKSLNRGTSIIIYEDVELNSYPEIDVEGMTAETFQTLISYLQRAK